MKRALSRRFQLVFALLAASLALVAPSGALRAQDNPPAGTATVVVAALNVRGGPDTTFEKLGRVTAGDSLQVMGKVGACTWLYVETPTGLLGWVAASSRFVKLDTACSAIPETYPATTAIVAQPGVAAGASAGASSSSTPVPAPTPAATPVPTAVPASQVVLYGTAVPNDQGCIAWGNYAGPDIHVTATLREPREIVETTLPNNKVTVVCYNPGMWSFTVSAISNRFRDLNFENRIEAGDALDWPFVSNR